MFLGVVNFVVFALFGLMSIKGYYNISSNIEGVRKEGIMYGQIILLFSFYTNPLCIFHVAIHGCF